MEFLAMIFAFCLTSSSGFVAYRWVIKPERERLRRRARQRVEGERARHWHVWNFDRRREWPLTSVEAEHARHWQKWRDAGRSRN